MALWGNKDSKSASGTVRVSSEGGDIGYLEGTGTLFTTQTKIGNTIYADGQQFVIVGIDSNTQAWVQGGVNGQPCPTTDGYVSYTISEKPVFVAQSESSDSFGDTGSSYTVFGVDAGEQQVGPGSVTNIAIIQGGSGYTEPAGVNIEAGEYAQAVAEVIAFDWNGPITQINVTDNGNYSYQHVPNVYINVPRRTVLMEGVGTVADRIYYTDHGLTSGTALTYYNNGGTTLAGLTHGATYYAYTMNDNEFKLYNTKTRAETAIADKTITMANVNTTSDVITIANHGLVTGAELNYNNQGGASIGNLTSGNDYFVIVVNANSIKLATTAENAAAGTQINISTTGNDAQTLASTGRLNLTGTGNDGQYFDVGSPVGVTATAKAVLGSGSENANNNNQTFGEYVTGEQHITHAGWVRKTVGTGGRAGRVHYETLVAMGSITGDQADDIQFPDD